MRFILKFIITDELKEFCREAHLMLHNLKDSETLTEGAFLGLGIIALYFFLVIAAI